MKAQQLILLACVLLMALTPAHPEDKRVKDIGFEKGFLFLKYGEEYKADVNICGERDNIYKGSYSAMAEFGKNKNEDGFVIDIGDDNYSGLSMIKINLKSSESGVVRIFLIDRDNELWESEDIPVNNGKWNEVNIAVDKMKVSRDSGNTDGDKRLTLSKINGFGLKYIKGSMELFIDDIGIWIRTNSQIAKKEKPVSKGTIRLENNKLIVNGREFFVKGVGYSPLPIGFGEDWNTLEVKSYNFSGDKRILKRDLSLLKKMGCNTIRTWATVEDELLLDMARKYGVYVIMGFRINQNLLDFSKGTDRNKVKNEFREYVKKYCKHPAVLMWCPGNEMNAWYNKDKYFWYTLLEELAEIAYEIEGAHYHPVTTANAGVDFIGDVNMNIDDDSMWALDCWGSTLYPIEDNIDKYKKISKKPFWVAEYGIPAWDFKDNIEGEDSQSKYDLSEWAKITAKKDICIGGCVMAYSDEWWKSGNPLKHEKPPEAWPAEWYGIVKVEKGDNNLDKVTPRKIYYQFMNLWK
ncbi:MAG: glycoside hydrolase family 2 TIM barrel-domain containing protein [Elusimicrobiota bacterium]